MATVHIQPISAMVRWYDTGSYEEKSPYRAICSYFHINDDTVFLYGMQGSMSKQDMAVFFKELLKKGIKYIIAERRRKLITRDIRLMLEKGRAISEEEKEVLDAGLAQR